MTVVKDASCQVWLKLAHWFWIEDFLILSMFSLFRNYLPLEKGRALHLNKLKSPSSKVALCQVWLKLAQWFLRRRFYNFINVFSLFRNYLPFEQTWNPFTQECFVPSLVEIGLMVLEKKMKMWKFMTTMTMTTTDNRQILIRKALLSLWLRWAN